MSHNIHRHILFRIMTSSLLVSLLPQSTASFGISATEPGIAVVLEQSTVANCTEYFADFNGSQLESGWNWFDPGSDASYNLTANPGFFRVSALSGNDLYPGANYNAPRLMRAVTGNFVVETLVAIDAIQDAQMAGLLVWQDNNNFLRLEHGYNATDGRARGIHFAKEQGDRYTELVAPGQVRTPSSTVGLRLQRQESTFVASWRTTSSAWTTIATTTLPLSQTISVGLDLIAQYNALTTVADFDYFRASSCASGIPCEVPFFWQRDPNGTNEHPLRGTCSPDFDTLGEGGCTLTSATMLFRHYGAGTTSDGTEMTPANLSDCMGTMACPFNWIRGAKCNNNKASYQPPKISFSYEQLDQELNQKHRPVILKMCKKSDCSITHWIVVVRGQGNDPANYTIWDPWFGCGQNMRLNSRSDSWNFIEMAVYNGTPACGFSTEVPLCARSVSPVGLPSGTSSASVKDNIGISTGSIASSIISGTALLYRATNITMTVHLTAQTSAGNVTEMLVWSDTVSNTVWQPFASYVWLPVSDFVYVRFRDSVGNISDVVTDTMNPSAPPVALDPSHIFLPLAIRE